jgi:hypothetical protein
LWVRGAEFNGPENSPLEGKSPNMKTECEKKGETKEKKKKMATLVREVFDSGDLANAEASFHKLTTALRSLGDHELRLLTPSFPRSRLVLSLPATLFTRAVAPPRCPSQLALLFRGCAGEEAVRAILKRTMMVTPILEVASASIFTMYITAAATWSSSSSSASSSSSSSSSSFSVSQVGSQSVVASFFAPVFVMEAVGVGDPVVRLVRNTIAAWAGAPGVGRVARAFSVCGPLVTVLAGFRSIHSVSQEEIAAGLAAWRASLGHDDEGLAEALERTLVARRVVLKPQAAPQVALPAFLAAELGSVLQSLVDKEAAWVEIGLSGAGDAGLSRAIEVCASAASGPLAVRAVMVLASAHLGSAAAALGRTGDVLAALARMASFQATATAAGAMQEAAFLAGVKLILQHDLGPGQIMVAAAEQRAVDVGRAWAQLGRVAGAAGSTAGVAGDAAGLWGRLVKVADEEDGIQFSDDVKRDTIALRTVHASPWGLAAMLAAAMASVPSSQEEVWRGIHALALAAPPVGLVLLAHHARSLHGAAQAGTPAAVPRDLAQPASWLAIEATSGPCAGLWEEVVRLSLRLAGDASVRSAKAMAEALRQQQLGPAEGLGQKDAPMLSAHMQSAAEGSGVGAVLAHASHVRLVAEIGPIKVVQDLLEEAYDFSPGYLAPAPLSGGLLAADLAAAIAITVGGPACVDELLFAGVPMLLGSSRATPRTAVFLAYLSARLVASSCHEPGRLAACRDRLLLLLEARPPPVLQLLQPSPNQQGQQFALQQQQNLTATYAAVLLALCGSRGLARSIASREIVNLLAQRGFPEAAVLYLTDRSERQELKDHVFKWMGAEATME